MSALNSFTMMAIEATPSDPTAANAARCSSEISGGFRGIEQVSIARFSGDFRAAARPRIGSGPNLQSYMSQPVRVTVMRKLSTITTPIIDKAAGRYHERRSVRSDVFNSLTVLALFKHDENDTQLFVSHNDDPLCAVWISKQPLLIDPRFAGRFVVITLTNQLAREKSLAHFPILDFDRYTPDERKQLQAAIDAAYRARVRHRGCAGQPMSTSGFRGRTTFG